MKTLLLFAVILTACNSSDNATTITNTDSMNTTTTVPASNDSNVIVPLPAPDTNDNINNDIPKEPKEPVTKTPTNPPSKNPNQTVYENKRFKDVRVEKIGDTKFKITGKGQIFEAAFSWVIEDGHNELKKGHEMTDAGAPAWGNFNFTVDAKKARPNSTLHLILYESSAKDGSRQYLLPIPLY